MNSTNNINNNNKNETISLKCTRYRDTAFTIYTTTTTIQYTSSPIRCLFVVKYTRKNRRELKNFKRIKVSNNKKKPIFNIFRDHHYKRAMMIIYRKTLSSQHTFNKKKILRFCKVLSVYMNFQHQATHSRKETNMKKEAYIKT